MKTKTDALKILVDAGWTYEEIESVLSSSPPDCSHCWLRNPGTWTVQYPPDNQYGKDNSELYPNYDGITITSADIKYTHKR